MDSGSDVPHRNAKCSISQLPRFCVARPRCLAGVQASAAAEAPLAPGARAPLARQPGSALRLRESDTARRARSGRCRRGEAACAAAAPAAQGRFRARPAATAAHEPRAGTAQRSGAWRGPARAAQRGCSAGPRRAEISASADRNSCDSARQPGQMTIELWPFRKEVRVPRRCHKQLIYVAPASKHESWARTRRSLRLTPRAVLTWRAGPGWILEKVRVFRLILRRGAPLACKPAPRQQLPTPPRARAQLGRHRSSAVRPRGRAGAPCARAGVMRRRWRAGGLLPSGRRRARKPRPAAPGVRWWRAAGAQHGSACSVHRAQQPRCAGGPASVAVPARKTTAKGMQLSSSHWDQTHDLSTGGPACAQSVCVREAATRANIVSTERPGTEPNAHAAGAYRRRLRDAGGGARRQLRERTRAALAQDSSHRPELQDA